MVPEPQFEAQPNVGNHFAWLRTQMAMQRTLMAAVRTSVSLIGFGFTVAQFFQKVLRSTPEHHLSPEAPRNLGLALIAAGVASLVLFVWQAHAATRYMHGPNFAALTPPGDKSMRSASYITAYVVIFVGVAAFLIVLMRL
ncbi:MAG: DUF202 domain-containing protein [Caulobacter sp.]|nr:DUF202 domain-containing protein [Caulobacter sp.]